MKHPIRRRFLYGGFLGLRALAQALPLRAAQAVGRSVGWLVYWALPSQRRLTRRHLALALGGELDGRQRARIARGVFANLGQTMMEWLHLPRLTRRDLQALIACDGVEHVRQALAQGNGAIAVTAHFGNWELIPLYLRSLGFEGAVLARRLRYPEYEAFQISLRGAHGVPTLARGSLKEVAKLLRANQIIGMLPDQDIDSLEGVFVEFFGHPAYTPVGPAALSLMTGAPIVPCFMIREGGRFHLRIELPLSAPPGDRAQAVAALTQAWSRVVESAIRRHPDQWVWMHRRWKTQPPACQPAADPQGTPVRRAVGPIATAWAAMLACTVLLGGAGCGRGPRAGAGNGPPAQEMSSFTLTGYEQDGTKRWVLNGTGAVADGPYITIDRPDAVGFDAQRMAYLKAAVAAIRQTDRHVRLEHDVTIHTSDGVWFMAPVLHWMPDLNRVATDTPVRIETDHMLVRGRGADGLLQLKEFQILKDVELVLNPSNRDAPREGRKQVTITCEGPLTFDYNLNIATFQRRVHVVDPSGELFSDKLIAYLDSATHTIRYAEATGRVRILQQRNTAQSERAVYEPGQSKITLVGNPSLLIFPSDDAPAGGSLPLGGFSSPAKAGPFGRAEAETAGVVASSTAR